MAGNELHERTREAAPGALLHLPGLLTDEAEKRMLKDGPKGMTRYVLTHVPAAPGHIYDTADVLTAKDKIRAGLGVAGGLAGGALGEAVGGPVGAYFGQIAGEAGSEWLYDHHDELARKAADTARWMKDRTAQAASRAAHGFDRGLPPLNAPLR